MLSNKEYNVTHTTIDVNTLINMLGNSKKMGLSLSPPYQRNVVWDNHNKNAFIDSTLLNIVPNNITFNIETDGSRTCIDGKQRCTTLFEFCNNRFPYTNSAGEYYFFGPDDDLQDKYTVSYPKYKVMSNIERSNFLNRHIPLTTYKHLGYLDQTDIFFRMQHGKKLSDGELIASKFADSDTLAILDAVNKKYEKKHFSKFLDGMDRADHRIFSISMLFYISNRLQNFNKIKRDKFVSEITDNKKFAASVNVLDKLFEFTFSDLLLSNAKVKKIKQFTLEVFLYCIYKKNILDKLKNKNVCDKLITIVNKLDNFTASLSGRRTDANLLSVEKKFNSLYDSSFGNLDDDEADDNNTDIDNDDDNTPIKKLTAKKPIIIDEEDDEPIKKPSAKKKPVTSADKTKEMLKNNIGNKLKPKNK